ncbi:hypothetical protein [Streptomyces sp. HM190]|uniref:hypothetical protein n=1 Tax=Streptomyces sp. HM190 TaxID=2695266 RepID=UPI00135A2C8F|nr:hypothetical protein [Streptomyces sp. HM190]
MTTVEFQDGRFQDGGFRDGRFRDGGFRDGGCPAVEHRGGHRDERCRDGGFRELVLVRGADGDAPAATAVIRVLGQLPGGWDHAWRLDEDGGRIHLRIRPPSGSPPHAVRDWLAEVLADPALRSWRAAQEP